MNSTESGGKIRQDTVGGPTQELPNLALGIFRNDISLEKVDIFLSKGFHGLKIHPYDLTTFPYELGDYL